MYQVMIIDPPWLKKKGGIRNERPKQTRELDYSTMPTKDIFTLLDKDLFPLLDEIHCVFMWSIDQYLLECENEMIARGYKRHCRFIWDKKNGVAPAFTVRYSHEYLIWFYKPKMMPINKLYRGKLTTVFTEKSREHSRKPDIAYDMIHCLYDTKNKIDVFSREKRDNYDQYGNQINHFN